MPALAPLGLADAKPTAWLSASLPLGTDWLKAIKSQSLLLPQKPTARLWHFKALGLAPPNHATYVFTHSVRSH